MKLLILSFLAIAALPVSGASLKEAYAGDFLMGTALGSLDVGHDYIYPMRRDAQELDVVVREFNCITAENLMKMQYIQPAEDFFNFQQADEFMAFAEQNRLVVVGHALVWHVQNPDWLFKDKEGNPVSREVLIERMRKHIHTVVGRYKGRVKYWDVVNEAVAAKMVVDETLPLDQEGRPQEKQVVSYRESPWLRIIGEDYIELAFRFAHEADPEARLLYNDYGMTDRAKVEFVAEMVQGLKSKGVRIDGVGMQGHWHLDYPSAAKLAAGIDLFASTGVKVSITELDVGVLPQAFKTQAADILLHAELRDELNPYADGIPDDVLARQAEKYRSLFEVLLEKREHIERVTFWGVSDKYSWKNDWPVNGRTDYPLLFDREFKPKPAYQALMELKK